MARTADPHTYLALKPAATHPRQPRLRAEYVRSDRTLQHFDEARELASRTRGVADDRLAADAAQHAWRIVHEADPVRLSYAAAVLDVTDQTVRDWLQAGLLEDRGGAPRRVGLESVARVRELVRDLRDAGRERDLMTAVLRRLELDELQGDERFNASLEELRRGQRA